MLHVFLRRHFVLLFQLLFFFTLFAFSASDASAQVSGINGAADRHDNDSGSSSGSSGGGASYNDYDDDDDDDWDDDDDDWNDSDWDSDYSGDLVEGCCYDVAGECVSFLLVNFFQENTRLVEDRHEDEHPWILGLQIMPQVGFHPNRYTVYQKPEARFNYGMLGMQLRGTDLSDNTGTYKTTDWQFLTINFPFSSDFNIFYGNGIMVEHRTDNVYYELMVGLELYFDDHKYNPTIEYRGAINQDGKPSPRQELNIRFDYNFINRDIFHLSLSGGYIYQNYYREIDMHLVQAGLNIGIY